MIKQQREEQSDEVLIFILDESYGNESNYVNSTEFEEEWAYVTAASQKYREGLEVEFQTEFEEVNVGPGADVPAFVTAVTNNIIPLLPWIIAVFFSGKPIVDNVEAWRDIFVHLKSFFSRPIILNRQGAAVIAVDAVFEEMGSVPKSIRLMNYRSDSGFDDQAPTLGRIGEIEEASRTLNLSMVRHVFQIEADGVTFMVTVNGKDATAKKL